MSQGLLPKMSDNFIAVKPKTYVEFYNIAKTAENNYKRNFNVINKLNGKTKNVNHSIVKPNKKPLNPCRICETLGFKNRYHWTQDCRNKTKNQNQTNAKQINLINSQSDETETN